MVGDFENSLAAPKFSESLAQRTLDEGVYVITEHYFEDSEDTLTIPYNLKNGYCTVAPDLGNIRWEMEEECQEIIGEIQESFHDWIQDLNDPETSKKLHLITESSLFLTFNYTLTLENLYLIPSEQVRHIHGSAIGEEELILGHNKNAEEIEEHLNRVSKIL